MTRFLVVDDHELVRRGLEQVLREGFPECEVGFARTAPEAMAQLAAGPCDLLLLDLNLPGRSGLELLEELRGRHPRLRVLVVSAYAEEEFALRCIRLGACGYVTKESAAEELLLAVRKGLGGGRYVTAALAERLADALSGDEPTPRHGALSPRELQVLRLVASGRTLKEISAALHLSESTVGTYRARISEKLGVSTGVELTRYALLNKLVE